MTVFKGRTVSMSSIFVDQIIFKTQKVSNDRKAVELTISRLERLWIKFRYQISGNFPGNTIIVKSWLLNLPIYN